MVLNCRTVSIGNHIQSLAGKLYVLIGSRKTEVVSFPSMNNEHKVPRLVFLTCLKVVYRKVPKGFNRKAFLSKSILKEFIRRTSQVRVTSQVRAKFQVFFISRFLSFFFLVYVLVAVTVISASTMTSV